MAEIQTAVNFKVFLFSNKKAMENVTEILNDESFTRCILQEYIIQYESWRFHSFLNILKPVLVF